MPRASYLLALSHAKHAQFLLIGDLLARCLDLHIKLPVLRLPQDLLGCDLNRRRSAILCLHISIRRHGYGNERAVRPEAGGMYWLPLGVRMFALGAVISATLGCGEA